MSSKAFLLRLGLAVLIIDAAFSALCLLGVFPLSDSLLVLVLGAFVLSGAAALEKQEAIPLERQPDALPHFTLDEVKPLPADEAPAARDLAREILGASTRDHSEDSNRTLAIVAVRQRVFSNETEGEPKA
ncbi:hypothetical protein ASH00_04600 [Arthrobacter sp. Soil782]|uniref:hypothetical protein n=1 Tax=Arthrobacter sp. Soil782 TaxID=1736410 RepID=UPI0006FFE960|nr:hypothetical protein [Arthrobacter sp. Soil782]KRF08961.1 hypothetical protein ASH00_04600 [Arthrobacter sp. Soil782]